MPDTSFDVFERRKSASLDPVLTFKWACESLPFGHDPTYVEEVNVPHPSLNAKSPLFGAGTYTYVPGFREIGTVNLSLYEDSKMTTTKWLKEWQSRIYRESDGAYFLPTNYKRDMFFSIMDVTGKVIAVVEMINAWPTTMSEWPLSYSNADRLVIRQDFAVDRVNVNF